MKQSFRTQFLFSFGIILGSLAAASAALYFLSGDMSGQVAAIAQNKSLLQQRAAALNILAQFKNDAPVASQYATAIRQLLPAHDDLIGFQQWLSGIAAPHHVSASVSFSGNNIPAGNGVPGTDNFSMTVDGAPADLVAFLQDLENKAQQYLLSIDAFDLTTGSSGGGMYHLAAQGRVFSR